MERYDLVVVGAGIIGLASAHSFRERHPSLRILILEKEEQVARHQSGHTSGIFHTGIYCRPNTLKARLTIEGGRRLAAFCDQHAIPCRRIGKLVLASETSEVPALRALFNWGKQNGVPDLQVLAPQELRTVEAHASAVAGLYVPSAAVVDFGCVAAKLAALLGDQGVEIRFNARVVSISDDSGWHLIRTADGRSLHARGLINCAGLYCDEIARMLGLRVGMQIVPFRRQYFHVRPERSDLVRGMIYPVPSPRFPFLGSHLHRSIDGQLLVGPTVMMAMSREGYRRSAFRFADVARTAGFRGARSLALRYLVPGLTALYQSLDRQAFVRSVQQMVPAIQPGDLAGFTTGVQAQAVTATGSLLENFLVASSPGAIHVLNTPSPAATAALAIGEHVADLAPQVIRGLR